MIKKIGLVVLGAVSLAAVYAALKSPDYTVYREVVVQAPAEKIFPLINNARAAERWMPWAEMDPQMKMSYSGPEEGVGAKASWQSPGKMGVGSSTITSSRPNDGVSFDLEYTKPFQMKQTAEISIRATGAANTVRWSVSGKNAFVGRFMCLFMNMDKMVGTSFEQGLANMKQIAEAS